MIGIKAGLALSESKLVRILQSNAEAFDNEFLILGGSTTWWQGDREEVVSLRAEEIEADFIVTMHEIGALPNRLSPTELVVEFTRQNAEVILGRWPAEPMEAAQLSSEIATRIAFAATGIEELPQELREIRGFDELYEDYVQRYILSRSMPRHRSWDGIISLNDLFQSEVIPTGTTEGHYFDQRFIDYLAEQHEDLANIHWRQFEYLVAEYFGRNGYEVKVGRGRDDGGIDITATRLDQFVGPEAIPIQCKKYGDAKPVGLDSVRAFWASIGDEGVTKGLIATTSRLTRGAKSYCDARQYRVSVAENNNIRNWLENMRNSD